jgi:hypothetical protein
MAPRVSRIHVGARVEGSHGPFIANPRGFARRIRARIMGTVIAAEASHRWTVRFDMDGKVKSCHSNGLKVLSRTPGAGIPLDEATGAMEEDLIAGGSGGLGCLSTQSDEATAGGDVSKNCYVFYFYFFAVSHTRLYLVLFIQVGIIDAPELLDHLEGIDTDDEDLDLNDQLADVPEAEPAADAHADGVVGPNNDFDAVIDGGQLHLLAMARATLAIHALAGTVVPAGRGNDEIQWKVVTEVTDDDYKDITPKVKFDFSGGDNLSEGMSSDEGLDDIPISVMFEKLLPGGIEGTAERLAYLNSLLVEEINPQRNRTHQRSIKIVTEGEFLTFLGILLGAVQCSVSGVNLWLVSTDKEATFSKMESFSKYLPLWRFKQIRSIIHRMMESPTAKANGDEWWKFSSFVDAFNRTRSECMILNGCTFVLDESMSAFVPR